MQIEAVSWFTQLCSATLRCTPRTGLVALLTVVLVAGAKDKAEKIYPEHGKITSMRTELETRTRGSGVYTDSSGDVHGGEVRTRVSRVPVYLIRTASMEYQIEGGRFGIGDEVNFRTEKGKLFIKSANKELKHSIVGQHLVDQGK